MINEINHNSNIMINIYNCFDFTFFENIKIFESYCQYCFISTVKNNNNLIFSLPNILTIILSQIEGCNFIIDNIIYLKKYTEYSLNDCAYSLISIICQINYNKKFIIYSINPNDGLWYSYEDQIIEKVQKMDLNAIPVALFYQEQNTLKYNYNGIQIEYNKILLNIRFNNQMPSLKLYFNGDDTVQNVIKKIASINKLKESQIKLLIDGKITNGDQLLSNVTQRNCNFLALIS
jgi:hypothetical protein